VAVRDILVVEHPVLRQKARRVSRVDASIVRLLDELTETMFAAHGAGLAAPQIGVALRAFVVRGDENTVHALVNPEIVRSEGSQVGFEACLSIPGYVGEVERSETVVVKGLNRRGKEVRIKASGYTARAFQHERDHLDGVLYTDKLTSLATFRRIEEHEAELEELAKAREREQAGTRAEEPVQAEV
jgi:peptide deformylase